MPSVFVGYIELAPRYSFIVLSILLPSFLLFDSSSSPNFCVPLLPLLYSISITSIFQCLFSVLYIFIYIFCCGFCI
ncbi:hypothetical protein B0H14DRAFT_2902963, partial [Mycena olivaceomarginata]